MQRSSNSVPPMPCWLECAEDLREGPIADEPGAPRVGDLREAVVRDLWWASQRRSDMIVADLVD